MKDIAIFGAGGCGREVACIIELINQEKRVWNFIGFFDDGITKGSTNEYGVILGGTEELNRWDKELAIVIAIALPDVLKKVVEQITNPAICFPSLISPDVLMLDKHSVLMGKGNVIHVRCIVSCHVSIGDFNLFNGFTTIGHDTVIGSYNVLMPAVKISGGVKMGDANFMGVGAIVLQHIKIGQGVRIGAGSVLMRKPLDNMLYVGNPAVKMEF